MASKTLVLFGLLLVFALFVSSSVAAEQTEGKNENKAGVQDYGRGGGYNNGPGYGGGYNHGGLGYGPGYGGGYHNGPGYNGGRYHNGPGYGCRWGCCRPGYRSGCQCCMHPDEVPMPMYIPEVQN